MTTRDDDRDFDAQFDSFLRGEDELSALLQGAPQPAPPPELDARIHAQARAALALAAPGAANDAATGASIDAVDEDDEPGPSRPLGRLRTPLALAATIVLGVSLGLQWSGWREPARPVSDATPVEPPPAAHDTNANANASVDPAPPPAHADAAPAPPPSPKTSAGARHHRRAPVAPMTPQAPVAENPPPATPAPAPAPAPQVPAQPPLDGIWHRAAPAPAFAPLPEQRADGAALRYSAPPSPPPPPAPAAAPAPVMAPPAASTHVEVTGSRVGVPGPGPEDASRRLARIAALLDQHRDADARAAWRAFQQRYPEAEAPPELRARLDALPPGTP